MSGAKEQFSDSVKRTCRSEGRLFHAWYFYNKDLLIECKF